MAVPETEYRITVLVEDTSGMLTVNCPLVDGSEADGVLAVMLTWVASLSVMVPVPTACVKEIILPPNEPSLRLTVNVSVGSTMLSPFTTMVMVCVSPLVPLNVRVPVWGT